MLIKGRCYLPGKLKVVGTIIIVPLNKFTIKIIARTVSQLFLVINYVHLKDQLQTKSFPGGFLRKSNFSILGEKFKFSYSGFGYGLVLAIKMCHMSWEINLYDRKCYEDHFEHS